jgi:hypothetical protein
VSKCVSSHEDFIESLLNYLDSQDIAARKQPKRELYVEQSELTKLWYVRDEQDGTIIIERETKRGALRAMRRLKANQS